MSTRQSHRVLKQFGLSLQTTLEATHAEHERGAERDGDEPDESEGE